MSTTSIQRNHLRAMLATPALAILMLFATGCSEQQSAAPEQTQAVETPAVQAAAPAPAAPAAMPEAVSEAVETAEATVEAAAVSGEAVYTKTCMACHAAGVANAPKLGDTAAWGPRIAKGNDALFGSVINGFNVMPPKGGCMNCSDDELRAAMEYMISKGS